MFYKSFFFETSTFFKKNQKNFFFYKKKRLQDGIAPSFVQKPTIKPDADGKRLCFECKIKSEPEPVITWYRDNTEIINKGKLN
jgi:hypothetical protein